MNQCENISVKTVCTICNPLMFHISNYFHNYEYKTRGIILLNEKDQFVSWQNVQSTVYQNIYFQRSFPSKPRVFVWTCISGR